MTGAESLSPGSQPVTENPSALSLSKGVAGISPLKRSAETLAQPQGKAFPAIMVLNGADRNSNHPPIDF